MASLRVYAPVDGGRVIKIRIAAEYAGVELKFVEDFKFGVTNKSAEFLAKFPLGKVPAVETPYGPLSESGAIARYVARINPAAGLLGGSFYEQSLVDQWIDFATSELESLLPKWLGPVWGMGAFDQTSYDSAKDTFAKLMKHLDTHLVANTFVAGDSITLADISVFAALKFYFGNVVTESDAAPYTSVLRWWNTLLAQKQFSAVVPDFKFCAQEKYAAGNPKAAGAAAAPAAAKAETKAAPAAEKKAEAAPAAAPKEEAKKGSKGKKEDKPKVEAKAEAAPAAAAAAPPASPEPKKAEAKKEPKAEAPKTPAKQEAKKEAKKETPKSAKKGGKGK